METEWDWCDDDHGNGGNTGLGLAGSCKFGGTFTHKAVSGGKIGGIRVKRSGEEIVGIVVWHRSEIMSEGRMQRFWWTEILCPVSAR